MDFSNNDRWHSDDWIKNVQAFLLPIVQKNQKEYYRKENARPKRKPCIIKYEKSFKGKVARKRTCCIRRKRVKHSIISNEEKEMIRQFYVDCPKGMHVDHIIPLSRGGVHSLSNLQWLDALTNSRKHAKCHSKNCEFPHCFLNKEMYL